MNVVMRNMRHAILAVSVLMGVVLPYTPAHAGITSKVLREALEYTTRKFGKEVAEEGVERLATKMSSLAAKHSDEVVAMAFKKVGPRAGKLVTEVGEHGDDLLRLLAKHGDAAIPLATRKTSLGLVKKFGEDAAEACVRHGSIAEPVIEQFGEAGARALTHVSERSGRQMAMMAGEGALKPELIDIVTRFGDKACNFIWSNKIALTGAAAMAAFVSAPEEFLNGTAQLAGTVVLPIAESVVAPLTQSVVAPITTSAAESFPWTMMWLILIVSVVFYVVWILSQGGITPASVCKPTTSTQQETKP